MIKAIITGDIIHSTKMNALQRNLLLENLDEFLKKWEKRLGMRSETYRGDSFQCLVENPFMALRIALIIKTYLRSLDLNTINHKRRPDSSEMKMISPFIFDARIAIGVGSVEYISKRLATSGGDAFELSGQLLDKIKSKKQSLAIATEDLFNDELEIESKLLDALISKTTALQCQVIFFKLLGYTEIKIASKLNVQQSAINQRSTNGSWNAIEATLERFEKIYSNENITNPIYN